MRPSNQILRPGLWLAVLFAALHLAACSSDSDDDGGGGDGMVDPPDDTAALTVPLDVGNVWTYREISVELESGDQPDTATVFIAAASTEELSDGTYVCIMSDDDGVRDASYTCNRDTAIYVRQEGDLFYYVPEGLLSRFGGDDPINVFFSQTAIESLPWVFADFTATEGSERILVDASTTVTVDGVPTDLSLLVRSQELGAEVADVPGGRWASRRNRTIITATINGAEGPLTSRITQNFWFVDDIGLARIDFRDEEIRGSTFVTEEVKTELVDWDID